MTTTPTLTAHPVTGWGVDPETGYVYGARGRWRGRRIGYVGSHGYRVTCLSGVAFLHHRVVWEACVGPIPAGYYINHLNGAKLDNRLANLEAVTPGENLRHAYATGLKIHCVTGPKNHNYRVTPEIEADILARLQTGQSGESVARRHGLSGKTVSRVKNGRR